MTRHVQKVVYRVFKGEVIALLPGQTANFGNVVIYAHNGQHSEADSFITRAGRLATPVEYAPLHKELTTRMFVYDDCTLRVMKRIAHADLKKGWTR